MIHEKTLEEIAAYLALGSMLIPSAYIALPLAYSVIKDLTKLYLKKECENPEYNQKEERIKFKYHPNSIKT